MVDKSDFDLQDIYFGDERDKKGISDRNIFSLEQSKRLKNSHELSIEDIEKIYKYSMERTSKSGKSSSGNSPSLQKTPNLKDLVHQKPSLPNSKRSSNRVKKTPGLLTKLQKKQQMIMNSEFTDLSSRNMTKRKKQEMINIESFEQFSSRNKANSIQSISNIKDSVDFILSNPSE